MLNRLPCVLGWIHVDAVWPIFLCLMEHFGEENGEQG